MNRELIKKLKMQATSHTWNGDGVTEELDEELFAKLIVQECIDILPEKVKIDDLYDGRILVQCGMAIKDHFGVEE